MPAAKPIRQWRASGRPEEFAVETVVLKPIEIDDPDRVLISVNEAAEILGVKGHTVTGHIDRGNFTVVRRSSSVRRWLLRDEVEAWAAQDGRADD
jgi:hypothetical protein